MNRGERWNKGRSDNMVSTVWSRRGSPGTLQPCPGGSEGTAPCRYSARGQGARALGCVQRAEVGSDLRVPSGNCQVF